MMSHILFLLGVSVVVTSACIILNEKWKHVAVSHIVSFIFMRWKTSLARRRRFGAVPRNAARLSTSQNSRRWSASFIVEDYRHRSVGRRSRISRMNTDL